MWDEGKLLRRLLEGIGDGDPFSYVVVFLTVGLVTYIMWRLIRDEGQPQTRSDWVRLIAIVVAGAGAITGILGIVAAFAFESSYGQHIALLGSSLFFSGFLVALISLAIEIRAELRETETPSD